MNDFEIRQLVADTGRLLVEKGLVARTWGNISCRVDDTHFAISPSGLGYDNMQAEDVPVYDYINDTYEGKRKPSSEKKVHAAAYANYSDVNCVIHTHQDYATAISLVGTDCLEMTEDERKLLGKVMVADYGLPGTDKLKSNVETALKQGSRIILMVHHGAVILGNDMEDAINKAEVLENICKRTVDKSIGNDSYKIVPLAEGVEKEKPGIICVTDSNLLFAANDGGIPSQLDDIAQMTGIKICSVENNAKSILKALSKTPAVLVKGVGCVICTNDADDCRALEILAKKAAMAYRLTESRNIKVRLSVFDCLLMRAVYTMKYSKQKKG